MNPRPNYRTTERFYSFTGQCFTPSIFSQEPYSNVFIGRVLWRFV